MESRTIASFWSLYSALPAAVRLAARAAYQVFVTNSQHPGLHRLAWDPRFWSVRLTGDYRAVGFVEGDVITWVWIGNHDDFDRAFPK
jgi:hypothetical protein